MGINGKALAFMSVMGMVLSGCGSPSASSESSSKTSSTTPSSSSSSSSVLSPYDDGSLPKDVRNLSSVDYAIMNLMGKDEKGREITRKDNRNEKHKYIGLFYSLWHGTHETGIYNISELETTEEGLAALNNVSGVNDELSPLNAFHFSGKPLFGYYHSADPYVLKKNLEMFIDAGVDYLCFDATNSVLYSSATLSLLKIWKEYQDKGYNVPKLCFYTNSFSSETVDALYANFYVDGDYDSLWFSIDGLRPLIIGITENNNNASDMTKYHQEGGTIITNAMQQYFDVRESEWPNGDHNENSIPWMSWSVPQRVHTETGAICVDVAQHSHSRIYVSSRDPECSRGYNNFTGKVEEDFTFGRSFQDMWDTVFDKKDEISLVTVTSWNEWMAIKSKTSENGKEVPMFVDVFDEEYSRDMDLSAGKNRDNFYLQLLENSRNLNYSPFVKYAKKQFSIDMNSIDPNWDNVLAYRSLDNNKAVRDYQGVISSLHYSDKTGRNDIKLVKLTQDNDNLYFYIECEDNLTKREENDKTFMNLLLSVNPSSPSFEGFDYVINREAKDGKASIEKSLGGYSFEKVGEASIRQEGKTLLLSIPRKTVSCVSSTDLGFKVTDHIADPTDIMDYYVSGDSFPIGRLKYGY